MLFEPREPRPVLSILSVVLPGSLMVIRWERRLGDGRAVALLQMLELTTDVIQTFILLRI